MIIDSFIFFNELELLEVRLFELAPVVHRFVLVEANQTFQGQPKKLYFDENKSQFSKYNIQYIVVDLPYIQNPTPEEVWKNEEYQRNQMIQGTKGATFIDTIMMSDVDEIPSREILSRVIFPCRLRHRFSYYYMNMIKEDERWYGTVIVPLRLLRRYTPQQWRSVRLPIVDAGWHCSYLGGIDKIMQKIDSFSHIELKDTPREQIERAIETGDDLFKREGKFTIIPFDDSFPHLLREGKYMEFIRNAK